MSDPFKEASKFHTAVKRADKWRDDYLEQIRAKHAEKLRALRATLSPAALRVVEAAEQTPGGSADAAHGDTAGEGPSGPGTANSAQPPGDPPIPPRLLEPVPPVPPGGIIVTEDKPKRGARA